MKNINAIPAPPVHLTEIPSEKQQLETAMRRYGFKTEEEALEHARKIAAKEEAAKEGGKI